jgi:uncharacterized membrane protein YcgQ (UPF0703/DUF1980 family)
MKRSVFFWIGVAAILAVLLVTVFWKMPPNRTTNSNAGEALLKFIKHEPASDNGSTNAEATLKLTERKSAIPSSGVIKLDDETFASGYDELYNNRKKYEGREISVSGYVETDHLPSGQFLVGRDLIWCCQSDKYFIGFLVLTDGAIPGADSELRVTGIIESAPYTDPDSGKTFDVPAIRVTKTEPAPKFSRDVFPM